MEVSAKGYDYITWKEAIEECDTTVSLLNIDIDESWTPIFETLETLQTITDRIVNDTREGKVIYPYPGLLFKAFEQPLDKVRVVILGQDPYHGAETIYSEVVPQAMGLSFSVPTGLKMPSSLMNIYRNLVNFGHLKQMPSHGNLERLQDQGVLFLNSALSVVKATPNSHQALWKRFTETIIKSLDSKDVIFVLWGRDAIDKGALLQRSMVVRSSHPSGYSCRNPCGSYPAFMECNFAKHLNVDWNVLLE